MNKNTSGSQLNLLLRRYQKKCDAMPCRSRVLAVASGGGHWVQLKRVLPVFEGHDVALVIADEGYVDEVEGRRFYAVQEASRWDRFRLVKQGFQIALILLRERPDLVISTGALPGFFALMFGKYIGAKTIWIDSIANAEEMSMSGRKVRPFADLWMTQWEQLARPGGPIYEGKLI